MSKPTVIMPLALTAENGAKALMMGEFTETTTVACPYCRENDPEFDDENPCTGCLNSLEMEQEVPVSWDTIKSIYAKAVEHLSTPTLRSD